ncbi:SEC-C metal-binding domain-containing protein [Providencia hangzhouensis]|uniref:SEC-C metal-binding domain-containing protein n=1 Tax=Providencia hangzhouensis TaxID=3031799 RepID=UPI0034DDAFC7
MAKIEPSELCPCESGLIFKDCHGLKVKRPKRTKIEQTVTLKVIPEPDPETRSIFEYTGEGTVLFQGGANDIALVCGFCQSHLVEGVPRENIQNIVIICKKCGSYNET